MTEGQPIERITLRQRLVTTFPFLEWLFPSKEKRCVLCGTPEHPEKTPHIQCSTPGCIGLFCMQCYEDLQNLCTICRSPIEYGDFTDISEEK